MKYFTCLITCAFLAIPLGAQPRGGMGPGAPAGARGGVHFNSRPAYTPPSNPFTFPVPVYPNTGGVNTMVGLPSQPGSITGYPRYRRYGNTYGGGFGVPLYGGYGYSYASESEPLYPPAPPVVVIGAPEAPPQPAPVAVEPRTEKPLLLEYGPDHWKGQEETSRPSVTNFSVFLNDGTMETASVCWVEGANLNYITDDGDMRRMPLRVVDRTRTERVNRENGVPLYIPPAGKSPTK